MIGSVACSFNNTTVDLDRKIALFDVLVNKSLKPLVENSRDYLQILDVTELHITLINILEELKGIVNQYPFTINFNQYLCEKCDFYTDSVIREKVVIGVFVELR